MNYPITTQKELRRAFWEENPDLQRHSGRTQNDCPPIPVPGGWSSSITCSGQAPSAKRLLTGQHFRREA